jgi:hypothetical protein
MGCRNCISIGTFYQLLSRSAQNECIVCPSIPTTDRIFIIFRTVCTLRVVSSIQFLFIPIQYNHCFTSSSNQTVFTKRLAPWSRVRFQKLIVIHLVEKFSASYLTRKFITVFKRDPFPVLSQMSSVHTYPP